MAPKKNSYEEENIKDILHKPPPHIPKPPRYVSIHHDQIKNDTDKEKTCKTMGFAHITLNDPKDFLRKNSGVQRPSANPQKRCLTNTTLPKVPPKCEIERTQEQKDFIKINVKSAKGRNPKSHEKYIIDSPRGHKSHVDDSNLKFVHNNKHFGIIPSYIVRRKNEMQRARDEYRAQLENQKPLCTLITQKERQELLDGLKENWKKAEKSLILLPLVIDTIGKIKKKSKIENEMIMLEKAISSVEKNPYIYVYE